MKVVIDTNVLISAALKDKDPEAIIIFVVAQPEIEWIVSAAILDEYKAVLARDKFKLPNEILQQWFSLLDKATTLIELGEMIIDLPRDQKDAMFLACAMSANAEFFITGDRDFSEASKLVSTTIISVALFKTLVIDSLTGKVSDEKS